MKLFFCSSFHLNTSESISVTSERCTWETARSLLCMICAFHFPFTVTEVQSGTGGDPGYKCLSDDESKSQDARDLSGGASDVFSSSTSPQDLYALPGKDHISSNPAGFPNESMMFLKS